MPKSGQYWTLFVACVFMPALLVAVLATVIIRVVIRWVQQRRSGQG